MAAKIEPFARDCQAVIRKGRGGAALARRLSRAIRSWLPKLKPPPVRMRFTGRDVRALAGHVGARVTVNAAGDVVPASPGDPVVGVVVAIDAAAASVAIGAPNSETPLAPGGDQRR